MARPLVLVDWYRTLSLKPFWHQCDSVTLSALQDSLFSNSALVNDWMRGQLSSEEICERFKSITSKEADLLGSLKRSCENLLPDSDVIEALKKLSERVTVTLVTDNMDCFARWTVPHLAKLGIFKNFVVSSDVGRLKNDESGKTFLEACARHQAPVNETHLIDDSAKTREVFQVLGGRPIATDSPNDTTVAIRALLEKI
jgi:FMN phosphatase YigB (HAD superfamily)